MHCRASSQWSKHHGPNIPNALCTECTTASATERGGIGWLLLAADGSELDRLLGFDFEDVHIEYVIFSSTQMLVTRGPWPSEAARSFLIAQSFEPFDGDKAVWKRTTARFPVMPADVQWTRLFI